MDSLFSFIKSYVPSTTRDPQEDYLTQLFAWLLVSIPELSTKYCQFLLTEILNPAFDIKGEEEISVQTQVVVEHGRIDLFLGVGKHGFVCEHKVYSNLGEQQINKYAASFSSHAGDFYTVLVTANTFQHTQDADISLTWADVSDFLIAAQTQYENEQGFLLDQLIRYLREQGLGRMEPLDMENILGFFPGQELQTKLETLSSQLQSMGWMKKCPGVQELSPGHYSPSFKKFRWGRVGVEMFDSMSPGLFAGVMLDYKQILSLKPSHKELGPDVVLMFEYDYYANPQNDYERNIREHRRVLLHHPSYQALCTRLRSTAVGAGFHFSQELPKSRWRILVLQKPLAIVLRGANTEREQLERLFETMCQGINLFVQDSLLAQVLECARAESSLGQP